MFEITEKVALVTGGAKGLGLSFARELLKNGLKGVSLIDIDVENGKKAVLELQAEYGKESAIFIKADCSKEAEFEEAFETTVELFKQLDIVINNAGIAQEIQWHKCLEVNLIAPITGSLLAMKKYLPKFKSGHEGVLVNIASVLGIIPAGGVPVYAATKSGVIGFSRSISDPLYYQEYQVRVLTVCPGLTDTSMIGLTEKQQHEPFRSLMNNGVGSLQSQSPEDCARHLISIIQEAASGSVWTLVKGGRLEVSFPTVEQ